VPLLNAVDIVCDECGASQERYDSREIPWGWRCLSPSNRLRVDAVTEIAVHPVYLCPNCTGAYVPEEAVKEAAQAAIKAVDALIAEEMKVSTDPAKYTRVAALSKIGKQLSTAYSTRVSAIVNKGLGDYDEEGEEGNYIGGRRLGLGIGDAADMQRELLAIAQKQIENNDKPRPKSTAEQITELCKTRQALIGAGRDGSSKTLQSIEKQLEDLEAKLVAENTPKEEPKETRGDEPRAG
jgi:hypothetical protein